MLTKFNSYISSRERGGSLENKNAERIYRIMQMFQRFHMQRSTEGEIPRGDLMMMKRIDANGESNEGVKISELASLMEISNSAVSQKINILEEKGHVERYSTKEDRRVVYARLTEEGKEVLKRQNERLLKRMSELFTKMGEEDTEKFIELLDKLYVIMQEKREEK